MKKYRKKEERASTKENIFWWISICYDLSRECGQRMAKKNVEKYQKMME